MASRSTPIPSEDTWSFTREATTTDGRPISKFQVTHLTEWRRFNIRKAVFCSQTTFVAFLKCLKCSFMSLSFPVCDLKVLHPRDQTSGCGVSAKSPREMLMCLWANKWVHIQQHMRFRFGNVTHVLLLLCLLSHSCCLLGLKSDCLDSNINIVIFFST